MVGRQTGVVGGGGGGADLSNYVTLAMLEENYVSKAFLNSLFAVHMKVRVKVTDPSTTPATVISDTTTDQLILPNATVPDDTIETDSETGYVTATTYTLDSIQALAGLWTNSYVSALGQNDSGGGGGGGGASALSQLVDVQLSSLSNGQMLIYDSTQGKWINVNIPVSGGTVTSVGVVPVSGSHLNVTGSPVTSSGTINIGLESGYSIPSNAKQSNWDSAYSWVQTSRTTLDDYGITNAYTKTEIATILADYATKTWVENKGYLTSSAISDMATKTWVTTALADYATKTWVENKGYLTSSAISDMATKTWVGQQGYLTSVSFSQITGKPTSLSGYGITDAVSSSTTWWGMSISNGAVSGGISNASYIEFSEIRANAGHGGYIDFHFNGSSSDYTSRIIESASGTLNINYGMFVRGNTTYIGGSLPNMDQSYRLHVDGASYISDSAYFGSQMMQDGSYFLMHCKDSGSNAYGLMIEGLAQTDNEIRSTFGFHPAGRNISYSDGSYDMTVLSIRYNLSTHDKYAIINNYLNVGDHVAITSNNGYIDIGGGRIQWDATNNALKVIKSDGTAANLYTTGGVSALGMSAGVSSIDTMTFGYLTVSNKLYFGNTSRYIQMTTGGVCEIETDGSPLFLHGSHETFIDEDGWMYCPALVVTNGGIDTLIVNDNSIDMNGTIRVEYNGQYKTLNMATAISLGIFS